MYYEGVVQDITEQKLAQNSLIENEGMFRKLIEQAPNGIFRIDSKGNFILANSKARQLLGCTEEEILNLNIIDTYSSEEEKEIGRQRLGQLQAGGNLTVE